MNAIGLTGTHFVVTPNDFRNMPSGSLAVMTAITGVVAAVASVFLLINSRSSVREQAVIPMIYAVVSLTLSSTALFISPKAGDIVCLITLVGCMVLFAGRMLADAVAS